MQRLLEECRDKNLLPETLLMENVPGLLFKNNIGAFEDWISFLESLGYTNSYDIVNSLDFGVPQQRKRVFMVSSLSNKTPFDFSKLQKVDKRPLEDYVDFDYEHQAPSDGLHKGNFEGALKKHQGRFIYNRSCSRNFTNNFTKITSYSDHTPTVITRSTIVKFDPKSGQSLLTPLDYFRLMGFTKEDYLSCENLHPKTTLFKQAGNSIVVDVLEALFRGIYVK